MIGPQFTEEVFILTVSLTVMLTTYLKKKVPVFSWRGWSLYGVWFHCSLKLHMNILELRLFT